MNKENIYRIVDANLNRAREGIRVAEEIARLYFNDAKLSSQLKSLRHQLTRVAQNSFEEKKLLFFRDSQKDVGRESMGSLEKKRADLESIVQANLRRSQEATRVLEEFGKLIKLKILPKTRGESAQSFKKIRFRLYTLEQKIMGLLKK
jgi:translation initiation factor 2B subunit (eIF-2B alpha/beta/delta family)